jgi:hypothetical protein
VERRGEGWPGEELVAVGAQDSAGEMRIIKIR